MVQMGCFKWFDSLLREAGIEVTEENIDEVNSVIHEYLSKQANYGHCSAEWRKAQKEIQADEQVRQMLVKELRILYLKWIRYNDY